MGGGGRPRCPSSDISTSQAQRRHEARHLSLCRGGGGLAVWLPSSPFLPCVRTPGAPPRWGLHGACFLRAQSCGPSRTLSPLPPRLAALSSGRGGALSAPPYLHPPPLEGRRCVCGGGCLVVIPSLHACRRHDASTAQARGAALVPLQGGGHALWLPSSPSLPCVRTPGGPPAGACTARALYGHGRVVRPAPSRRCLPTLPLCPPGGGRFSPPPSCIPHPWGDGGVWAGGAPLSSSLRSTHVAGTTQAWRRYEARHLSLCRGGGLAVCHPSSPLLPCVRIPGGAEVCGGGGAPLSSPLRCTHVAGTTQARRKHGVRHLAAAGGGVSPLGLPALLHGIGSAPQDHQPLLSLGGSRHGSESCSVSRACSLLCPYLLEEERTRVETEDEEVRAAGRTYRTRRRLLAPSAALVEGRAPVAAPNSPGGADCPSSPWRLCIPFRAA